MPERRLCIPREPVIAAHALWYRAMLFNQSIHQVHGTPATGNHRKLCVKSFEVELAHEALMAVTDEKAARARFELFLHQLELPLGEPKSVHIVLSIRICIR